MWDSPSLLAFSNIAYRDLQDSMARAGITVNRAVAILLACPGATVALTLGSSPALPADFVLPYGMEERTASSSDLYSPMDESDTIPLPDIAPSASRGVWAYYQNQINLPPSTNAQDFRLDYEQRLSPFATQTDAVGIIGGVNVLAHHVASMIASSRGANSVAASEETAHQKALRTYLGTHVQGQQFKAGRRVRFGYAQNRRSR